VFYSVPQCLKSRFSKLESHPPILLGSGKSSTKGKFNNKTHRMLGMYLTGAVANGDVVHGNK